MMSTILARPWLIRARISEASKHHMRKKKMKRKSPRWWVIQSFGLKNRKNEQLTQEMHHKSIHQIQESMKTKVPTPAKAKSLACSNLLNRNKKEKQKNPSEQKVVEVVVSRIILKHNNRSQQRSSNSRWQSLNLRPRRWQVVCNN